MFAQSWLAPARQSNAVPKEIYASHVDALFSDARSFLIGVVAASLMALVTGLETHRFTIVAIAVALASLGGMRLWSMRLFAKRRPALDHCDLRRWERWYVVGGSAHVALLGLFCLATFGLTEDPFARIASVAITIAYLIGTPGRSFANDLLVNAQILSAGIPMLIALAIAGPVYWFIILLVLVPFLLALKSISVRLRGIFLSAVLRARDLSALATRFDTALHNMPQGLAMVEADGRITVSNRRLLDLLSLPPEALKGDMTFATLIESCAQAGAVEPRNALALLQEISDGGNLSAEDSSVLQMSDDRSIAFRLQPMSNGGGVILAEDVTERLRAEASINYLARYDSLTGLPNRYSFREHVQQAFDSARAPAGALMLIDLDQFKQVNDTLGHVFGDKLLRSVSERLRVVVGPGGGMVARLGGDEFVMFQDFDDPRHDAAQRASLLIQQMAEPFEIEGNKVVVGASVGIAITLEVGQNVDDLLRDADLALYRAKAEGRGTFRFFEGHMQVQAVARREIEKDLREALARDEFELHYQPIYDLATKRFSVCEALLRWKHPKHGMVSPADFIPIAEEMGLIWDIGGWVLRRACRDCANWPTDINVAVNISAMQFRRGNIASFVRQAIKEAGIKADRLELEITESALLHDLQATRLVLHQVREIGVRLSLDDFGTGYSSLSYLQSLPFNKIKIDRSFLQGLERDSRALTLLRGITRLSADLGLSVVMEGVETDAQLTLVVDHAQVTEVQGYLFSRPLPLGQLLPLLRSQMNAAVA